MRHGSMGSKKCHLPGVTATIARMRVLCAFSTSQAAAAAPTALKSQKHSPPLSRPVSTALPSCCCSRLAALRWCCNLAVMEPSSPTEWMVISLSHDRAYDCKQHTQTARTIRSTTKHACKPAADGIHRCCSKPPALCWCRMVAVNYPLLPTERTIMRAITQQSIQLHTDMQRQQPSCQTSMQFLLL